MLEAYVDESVKDNIFVIAGYVAPVENWAAFSEEWKALLDAPQPLASFKMSRMARSARRLKRAEGFYRVIERHVSFAFACTVYADEMDESQRRTNWPPWASSKPLTPYAFGFKAVIDKLAQTQHLFGINDPVNFIFDERTEKQPLLDSYEIMKSTSAPEFSKFMGELPEFRDDSKVLPLQACDLWAWWVRNWEEQGERDWGNNQMFPWEIDTPIPGFSVQFGKEDFDIEFGKMSKRAWNMEE